MGKIDREPVESSSGPPLPSPAESGREGGRVEEYFRWDPLDDPRFSPLIVGSGSIGGKGRSLLFAMARIWDSGEETLKRVIFPRSLFIAADAFDEVLSGIPDLEKLKAGDPGELEAAFLKASLPERVSLAVRAFLEEVTDPIIVRSSSVLEDSLKYSFAGKYLSTFEFNDGALSLEERCEKVEGDIKKIYARTFFPVALAYRRKHGMGDDRMGIILMRVAGKWRGRYYYPTMAGVGFSRYYRRWTSRIKSEDGIIRLVFGMGTTSTKRGYARTFALTLPCLRPEGQNPFNIMRHSQEHFQVIDREQKELVTVDVKQIWEDIFPYHSCFPDYAQVYTPDDHGGYFTPVSRRGTMIQKGEKVCFTFEEFACRSNHFFDRMKKLLSLLDREMGVPADVEFAYHPGEDLVEVLQARPLWISDQDRRVEIPDLTNRTVILKADRMVTHGMRENIPWLVYIDHHIYAGETRFHDVARAVGAVNEKLRGERYILAAPGRVGSSNPLLGVPVQYDEITQCCCIAEIGFPKEGYMPELSFGTHFFTDLEIDGILYMPVYEGAKNNIFDEEFLNSAPYATGPHPAVRLYGGSFSVYTDGDRNLGVITADRIDEASSPFCS
ncbi:PEP/pyruvate-binding domain-containing protein [Aminivibrio sp.]